DRARRRIDQELDLIGIYAQRWHQHDDVAKRPQNHPVLSDLLRDARPDACRWIERFALIAITDELDADHQPALANIANVRQPSAALCEPFTQLHRAGAD